MKFLFLLMPLSLLSLFQDSLRKDMDALQGTWFAVTLQDEDRKAPLAAIKQFKLVVKDQKMTFSMEGINDAREMGFRLDPAQNPPTIDLVPLAGAEHGKTIPGIYKLEADTLTICLPTKPDAKKELVRPKSFECKKGSGLGLFVVKKKTN